MANGTSLGAADCKPHHNIYLKTVYTCIHSDVLKPQYIDQPLTTTSTVSPTTTTVSTTTTLSSTTKILLEETTTIYEKEMKPAEKMLDDDINTAVSDQVLIGSDFDFSAEKNRKEVSAEESNLVVGFLGDFFNSYKTIKENKEKFIWFISLTVAAGLCVFLALFLWNSYRSNRLDRIAKSLRQPNLSQSTLCSATGSSSCPPQMPPQTASRAASIDNGTINAYSTSPAHSPNCPPGAIDIELEVGDHEVDTIFRDPGPKPLIMARATPPLQVNNG